MLSKSEIQSLLDQMAAAYRAGDAAACAAMFAENAQLHSPFGPPSTGREAIRVLHEEWTAEPNTKKFSIIDHGSAGDMAWCLARFSEGDVTGDGTSLIVFEKQQTASWLIRACCLYEGD